MLRSSVEDFVSGKSHPTWMLCCAKHEMHMPDHSGAAASVGICALWYVQDLSVCRSTGTFVNMHCAHSSAQTGIIHDAMEGMRWSFGASLDTSVLLRMQGCRCDSNAAPVFKGAGIVPSYLYTYSRTGQRTLNSAIYFLPLLTVV